MDTGTRELWRGEELRSDAQAPPAIDIALAHVRPGYRFGLHIVTPQPGSHTVQFVGLIRREGESSASIKQVELRLHTEPLSHCKVSQESAAWSIANGGAANAKVAFTGSLLLSELPRRFVITAYAATEGNWTPVAYIRGAHALSNLAEAPARFAPLLVTTAGRSGSTMLMKALCASAEVVAPAFYPYETRPLTYYWRVSQVASRPGDPIGSMSPDGFELTRGSVGYNPYFTDPFLNSMPDGRLRSWLSIEAPRRMARHTIDLVDAYGDTLCASLGKRGARFIAEKILPSSLVNYILAHHPHGKEIFLVRDCRDVLLSSWDFAQRRDVNGFGLSGGTLEEEIERHVSHSAQRARTYLDRRDEVLLVRYEDLVRDPAAELARIFDYVGLDPEGVDAAVAAVNDVEPGHMTSRSREQSTQRWRRALTPEQQAMAAEMHREFLETFGYA